MILQAREVNGTWQKCNAAAVQAYAARMYVRYEDLLKGSRCDTVGRALHACAALHSLSCLRQNLLPPAVMLLGPAASCGP